MPVRAVCPVYIGNPDGWPENHTAVQNANATLAQVLSELGWDLPEAERAELNLAWHRLDGPPSPPGGAVICMVASLFIVV